MPRTRFAVVRALLFVAVLTGCAWEARGQAPVIRGACCLADGHCVRYRQGVCNNQGGIWQGANTLCSPNPCAQPRGACCLPDGGCAWVRPAGCTARGGVYQGNNTTCGVRTCPRPTPAGGGGSGGGGGGGGGGGTPPQFPIGACCLIDLTCIETTGEDCASRSGAFQGVDVPCFHVYCPAAAPAAACCYADGSCLTLPAVNCTGRGGYFNAGVACSPTACAAALGACCGAQGTCTFTTPAACGAGHYRGNRVACSNAGCDPNSGACCLHDSSCVMVLPFECTDLSGRFRGVGALCAQQFCVDPTDIYACCLGAGTCTASLLSDCLTRAGAFVVGVSCQPGMCLTVGKCCFGDGRCQTLPAANCTGNGTMFALAAACTAVFCPRACPCNWSGDRWLNEGDFLQFVLDWYHGDADYDGNGVTNVEDLRAFVECILNPPEGCQSRN